ncbi:MAG: hypothetical protein J6U95_02615 [Alistipes sp.]|nr:hypothetical protein [Alistipes sp.]
MRRFVITLLALFGVMSLSAQTTPQEWISALNTTLGERYAFGITVVVGTGNDTTTLHGAIKVEGDAYYLMLGTMEVYSDGKLRYEINNERKEVSEDRVDLKSHDLLTNPTRAFSFLDSEFKMAMRSAHDANTKYIDLTPREDIGITTITLALKRSGARVMPEAVSYYYDGDVVTITMQPLDATSWKLPRWNKASYAAYDIVSFL